MRYSLFALILLASAAVAQNLPDYYPKNGLMQTGIIDEVDFERSRIVIDDIFYRMNARPIVRSPSSAYDSIARIRPGARVAFRMDINNEIVEFWLVPKNYRMGGPTPRSRS